MNELTDVCLALCELDNVALFYHLDGLWSSESEWKETEEEGSRGGGTGNVHREGAISEQRERLAVN